MTALKIEKLIAKDHKEVFKALREGKLFMNCSADSNSMQIDFRVGGKYILNFKNHKVSNWGEFLEIIPDRKIVFSWCQTFGDDQKPDTKVTIELFPEGTKTKLILEHSGFKDQSVCDNHYQGWNGGLTDLATEMEKGQIRLLRRYDVSQEKLFRTIKESPNLFGEVKDLVQNQRMYIDSGITLLFSARDDKSSALEIIQEGLISADDRDKNRNHMDRITTQLMEMLG